MSDILILLLIFIPSTVFAFGFVLFQLDFGPYWIRDLKQAFGNKVLLLKQKWLRVKAEFYKRASDLFYRLSEKSRERFTYILFEHPLYVGKREGPHSQLGTRPTRTIKSNKK